MTFSSLYPRVLRRVTIYSFLQDTSELPDLSELYALCLGISGVDTDQQFHPLGSTPSHSGPVEDDDRALSNIQGSVLDELHKALNDKLDRLENPLISKIVELQPYNKELGKLKNLQRHNASTEFSYK